MIPKYLATLAATVLLVTLATLSFQFATRAEVLAGSTVNETVQLEFTLDADSSHFYPVSPDIKRFLEDHITFSTEGAAHVASVKIEITPKKVSWTENHSTITGTGAALAAQLQWDTPPDSANGTHGDIYIHFPEVPSLDSTLVNFRSGGYQKDDHGHYIVREVTTYRSAFLLSVARFDFALAAGLPFGIVLHSLLWAFVLARERRRRLAALPPRGSGWPQLFYTNPVTEWIVWLFILGIGSLVASLLAGFSVSDGFMSSSMVHFIDGMLAVGIVGASIGVYFSRKTILTVRLEEKSIAYARGRGTLEWQEAAWTDVAQCTERSRTNRGSTVHWIELEFKDARKKLKITTSVEEYTTLRDLLTGVFKA